MMRGAARVGEELAVVADQAAGGHVEDDDACLPAAGRTHVDWSLAFALG
jgi:hypothetical protein